MIMIVLLLELALGSIVGPAPCQDPDGLVRVMPGQSVTLAVDGHTVELVNPLDLPMGIIARPLTLSGSTYRDTAISAGVGLSVRFVEITAEPIGPDDTTCAIREIDAPETPRRLTLSLDTREKFTCHLVQRMGADFDDVPEDVAQSRLESFSTVDFSVPGAGEWACIDRPRTKEEIEADARSIAEYVKSFSEFRDMIQGYTGSPNMRDDVSTFTLFVILVIFTGILGGFVLLWLMFRLKRDLSAARIREQALVVKRENRFAIARWHVERAVSRV